MKIPSWISKVASESEEEKTKVNLQDPIYSELKEKVGEDEDKLTALSEIDFLVNFANYAISQLAVQMGLIKEAASKQMPSLPKLPPEMSVPEAREKITEVPPSLPGDKGGKLPGKIREPETTKWKEIRFNKRTGTWQTVVTTRHTRNFATENEAVEFTKKAELNDTIEKLS